MHSVSIITKYLLMVLVVVITAEFTITYVDMCGEMIAEVADFGETGQESESQKEKKTDKYFSLYKPAFVQKEHVQLDSLHSQQRCPEVFLAILTPPPNA